VRYHKVLSFLFLKYMVQLQIVLLFLLLCTCYLQEISLKQHMQDEMEKTVISNETSLPILEYDAPLFRKLKVEQLKLRPSCLRQRAQFLNVCYDINELFICSYFKSTSCINDFNLIVLFRLWCVF
jgi:hypothetical protein